LELYDEDRDSVELDDMLWPELNYVYCNYKKMFINGTPRSLKNVRKHNKAKLYEYLAMKNLSCNHH
jgi:hypothetical protein